MSLAYDVAVFSGKRHLTKNQKSARPIPWFGLRIQDMGLLVDYMIMVMAAPMMCMHIRGSCHWIKWLRPVNRRRETILIPSEEKSVFWDVFRRLRTSRPDSNNLAMDCSKWQWNWSVHTLLEIWCVLERSWQRPMQRCSFLWKLRQPWKRIVKSILKQSYDNQNLTLVVISYGIYEAHQRLVSDVLRKILRNWYNSIPTSHPDTMREIAQNVTSPTNHQRWTTISLVGGHRANLNKINKAPTTNKMTNSA